MGAEMTEIDALDTHSVGEAKPAGAARLTGEANPAEGGASANGGHPQECCCHHKSTPRSREFQDDLQRRLNRVIGQLNGVKGMLDDNRYCGDVLVQLAAAESAIRNVSLMLLSDHMETCVVEKIRQGDDQVVEELMALVKRFAR